MSGMASSRNSAPARWGRAVLEDAFKRAAERGHACDNVIRVQQTKHMSGYAVLCSCGWQSNSRKRPTTAALLAVSHVADVLGVDESTFEPMTGPVPPEAPANGRRILCAHADDDESRARGEDPSHWLEPGEVCPRTAERARGALRLA